MPQLNFILFSKGFGETETHAGTPQGLYIDIVPRLTSVDETVPLSNPDTTTPPKETDFVFQSSVFKEHEPRRFYYKYLEILKDANIQNADFHTLRHTLATRAIENVMDINTLSAILGHAQTSTTVNRYCHAIEEYKKIGMEKVAYIFTNNNK